MSLPKYKDLSTISTLKEVKQEISLLQKDLFDLRLKKGTNQSIKSHLFTHLKRRRVQLIFKESILIKTLKTNQIS
jgi:ribosomal protein L29